MRRSGKLVKKRGEGLGVFRRGWRKKSRWGKVTKKKHGEEVGFQIAGK